MKTPRRIPRSSILKGTKPALTLDNPDTFWLSDDEFSKLSGSSSDNRYLSSPSSSASPQSGIQPDLSKLFLNGTIQVDENGQLDIVSLSDIESITYEQYYDSVTKLIKYKAIIKIRNGSLNKVKVKGVDARIYNPNA
jgi:hypothetical protein